MLAIKAKYDNGIVRWLGKPPVSGMHDLIVLFEDVPERVSEAGLSSKNDQTLISKEAMQPLPELSGFVPDGWKEAIYGG
jgi:hypothetical protein